MADLPKRDLPKGAELSVQLARVVQYHSGYNYYSVALMQGGAIKKAVATGQTPGIGVCDHHVVPPGTVVVVLDSPGYDDVGSRSSYLTIIGTVGPLTANQALSLSDCTDILSGAGYVFDKIHSFISSDRTTAAGPIPAGGGVPIDALSGERGAFSPLGVGWFVGLAMAYLRASERCGVWMFRLDEHLRVLAKSIEQQSMAREVLDLYDDGEVSVIERVAFVPWEALGAFADGTPVGVETVGDFSDPKKPPKSLPMNPVEVDQQAIFRYLEMKGYLGDLVDVFVSLPIKSSGVNKASDATEVSQGLFRQVIGADGRFVLQSAKGIHLEKYPLIQVPTQLRDTDDPAGDTPANYKASGTYGSGAAQKRTDFAPEKGPEAVGLMGLAMHGAYISKGSLQTLRAHAKDWRVPDEGKTPFAEKGLRGTYTADGTSGLQVDPRKLWQGFPLYKGGFNVQKGRWENVRYYAGRSAIDMWDDGSVVIEDAWGSQIIMTGGNIVITCPGDIIYAPGRSAITLAPQDIVQRAGNSVDVTATRRDVTIKAEKNLKVIGGNTDGGGVLVESRSTKETFNYAQDGEKSEVAGLVLVSKGTAAFVGKDVSIVASDDVIVQSDYLYAEADTAAHVRSLSGDVILGAGGTRYIFGSSECALGVGGTPSIFISGNLQALGSLNTRSGISAGAGIQCNGGGTFSGSITAASESNSITSRAVATELAAIPQRVSQLYDTGTVDAQANANEIQDRIDERTSQPATYFNVEEVTGNVRASLRTEKDYRTDTSTGFVLAQWRWQQYLSSGSGAKWTEKPVRGANGDTYPWPGAPWLKDSGAYLIYELGSYDVRAGQSTAGGDVTDPTVTKTNAQDGYLVNSLET